jgi:DNA-binding NarL/FixJ family response regulator
MGTLRILIADDHDLVRRGVRLLLEAHPDWKVCAEARSGREASTTTRSARANAAAAPMEMRGGGPGGGNDDDHGGKNGNSSLGDLNQQFGNCLAVNGDNTFTDPAVAGAIKATIHARVGPQETVP